MRIGPVIAERAGGRWVVSAEIERGRHGSAPFRLEVAWPESLGVEPTIQADPFLAALVIPAMALGENLEARGPVSPSLLDNLGRVVELLVGWGERNEFGRLRPVRIHSERLEKAPAGDSRHGLFFSGGVDSFHALRTLRQAGDPPDMLLLVQGFDISLESKALFETIHRRLGDAVREQGFELATVSTNLRQLTDPIVSWELEHGAAMALIGLALGGGFQRFTVASADSYVTKTPYGTNVELDPLWSRAGVNFETLGTKLKRSDKLAELAREPASVRENLRVCYKNPGGAYNCGHCAKCVRTMAQLASLDLLEQFPALPPSIDVADLEPVIEPLRRLFLWHDALGLLRARGDRPELAAAVERLIQRSEDVLELPLWRCLFRPQGPRLVRERLIRWGRAHATPGWRRTIRAVRGGLPSK